jgi:predicted ABC-type ATPase
MAAESYKLPYETHEEIYELLLDKILKKTERQENPQIVILGGQPGSGKSRLIEIACEAVFGNRPVAVINGDDYRAFHPQASEIYSRHDKRFSELTDPDVRKWTSRLFEAAADGGRDIIFEATMRNKEPLMSTIKALKEMGYRIGIMVMAVNWQVSRMGIVRRYESQREKNLIARWTPFESHDEAYRNMPRTVAAIEQESPIDSIAVYGRAGNLIYANGAAGDPFKRPLDGIGADRAIREERSGPLSPGE